MENIRGNEVFLNTERKPSSRTYFLDGVAGVANSGELAGSKMAGGNEVLCPDKTQWPLKYEEAARLIKIYIYIYIDGKIRVMLLPNAKQIAIRLFS